MNKLRVLGLVSLLAKLGIVFGFYSTVFSISKSVGILVLVSHAIYEVSELFFELELRKQASQKMHELYDVYSSNNRGNC